jgi:histidinol-phosphate aminotransferase
VAAPTAKPFALPPIPLDRNENPYGPVPAALKAAVEAARLGHRYPTNARDLIEALAKHHGVEKTNVLLGIGSGELLRAAVPAFAGPTRPLAAPVPTFETCPQFARRLGYPLREVRVDKGLRLDLSGLEDAAKGAGLLFLCNPNNPTGSIVPTKEVAAVIDRLEDRSPETVTLVDEAYHHFVTDPAYETLAARAARDRRLLVSRTFSKIYGLAGMRVGYAIGHRDTLELLRAHMTSAYIPVMSAAAALAALADEAETRHQAELNNRTRATTVKFFESLGYPVVPSEANFVMVEIQRDAAAFQEACKAKGVSVGRPFPPLKQHARITIGTPEEMQKAMEVFRAVLAVPAKAA